MASGVLRGEVSTHSRLKAAGPAVRIPAQHLRRFNTQPPKGGWLSLLGYIFLKRSFNTQPPKDGWRPACADGAPPARFNTQPPKGGWTFT